MDAHARHLAGRAPRIVAGQRTHLDHVGNIEMFRLEVGRYPGNLAELVRAPGGTEAKWNGPYAKEGDLKDAWGNDYTYAVPGQGKPFDLLSMGADGRPGGDGENRDVSN